MIGSNSASAANGHEVLSEPAGSLSGVSTTARWLYPVVVWLPQVGYNGR